MTADPRPSRARRLAGWASAHHLGWLAVSVLAVAVAVVVIWVVKARFLFTGDKQSLFMPVMRDIGHRLLHGEFPVIDPDLGAAGNYALNPQFGLYEPFQLLTSVVLSRADNLVVAGALWSAVLLMGLCVGTALLLLRLRVPGAWAAAGAVGVSLAGYTLYQFAPSWMAGMGSVVWLPWWWWSWYGRPGSRWSLLGLGVFGYLVVATGWAPTWLAAGFIGLGLLSEDVAGRPRGGGRELRRWGRSLLSRVLASLGGVVAGATVTVPLLEAYQYTVRTTAVADTGRFRPNLADLLSLASPTHGFYDQVPAAHPGAPIFFVGWFVLVLAWGVCWSRASRVRGVVAAGVATALAALATQLPFFLGPLRQGLRNLEGFQLCVVILVVVAYAHAPAAWTRRRTTGAVASSLVTAYLAWAQDPTSRRVLVGAALVTGCVVVLLVLLRLGTRGEVHRWVTLPATFALASTVLLTGWAVHAYPYPAGHNDHGVSAEPPGRAPGLAPDLPTLTIYQRLPQAGLHRLYRHGIGYGFTRLSPAYRLVNGASSIGQHYLNKQLCLGWYGQGCAQLPARLMAVEPTTGASWIDLLGIQQVQVAPGKPDLAWQRAAGTAWVPVGRSGGVTVYHRARPLPTVGRITEVQGPATVTTLSLENGRQRYQVQAGNADTRLVFRDIYWPGYSATLDGRPLAVTPVAGAFVSVVVPSGAAGELVVSYSPAGTEVMIGLWLGGAALLLVAMAVPVRKEPS